METRERLQLILRETNPWWKDPAYRLENYSVRQIFSDLEKFLATPQIIALVGLRRTGKTTLLLKIIEDYLNRLKSDHCLYFSFDDFSHIDLEEILLVYQELFPAVNLKKEKFVFCFDEIQKLENWPEKVKRFYDTYPNIKVVISGSESLFLRKKMKESLAGRIFEFRVSSLNFGEFLRFLKCENMADKPELYKEDLKKLYREFLKTAGFPELAGMKDTLVIHKYLKESVIDKILFKDIPSVFKVRNPDYLSEILDIIIFSPGQLLDMTKLGKELGLSRQVVSSYLGYLEKSFLIRKLYNFSRNLRKQKRALKKYYPALVFPSQTEESFPLCFENSLIWQLDIQFFYRDVYKREVDGILVGDNKELVPIEIKTGKIDFANLAYFMKKYQVKKGIVISWDTRGRQDGVSVVPFYEYLLGSYLR